MPFSFPTGNSYFELIKRNMKVTMPLASELHRTELRFEEYFPEVTLLCAAMCINLTIPVKRPFRFISFI
ncbi:hypothetical protein XENTR_v10013992 [Xenopus tropicalis]|nr:hypothetical protein XENTR_v10013992 [Xenopus tropicalis]